ncbi:MAG: hypothetical protein LC620_04415 [Halobacteriales archaeon]|nr:hypothetical protein [Halobacteriales archaeon]
MEVRGPSFLLALLLAGCIAVERDTTQCEVDDGWGGTRTVFDPSGECATNPFFLPNWEDLKVTLADGTATVQAVYDDHGAHLRDWSEFTFILNRTGLEPSPPDGVSIMLDDGTPLPVPPGGLRMPAGPVRLGDTVRFCLATSFAKGIRDVSAAPRVDHPRAYRTEWRLGILRSCDGTGPDTRELEFRVGNGTLTLTSVRGSAAGPGAGLSDWSEFILRASNQQGVGVRAGLAGGDIRDVGNQGLVLPRQPMRLGDRLVLCLVSPDEWDARQVVVEVHVDPVHDDDLTTATLVGRIPLC